MGLLNDILGRYKQGNVLNIGACGFKLFIHSLYTFPLGFEINEFADDRDPFDLPDISLGTYEPDLNGNLVFYNRPTPFPVDLYLIPNSGADKNCRQLFNSNFQSSWKFSGNDLVTMIATYASGETKIALGGHINIGSPMPSAAVNGRLKSQHYQFIFNKPLN
jgi:hypothetical protein